MLNPSVREAIFHLKTAVTFLIFIASKLTNEVPFERYICPLIIIL
jgi:hypothetical protein